MRSLGERERESRAEAERGRQRKEERESKECGSRNAAAMKVKKKRSLSTPTNEELETFNQTELLYKSNLFRLQTAELVREALPLQSSTLEPALRSLRTQMLALEPAELSWQRGLKDALPLVSHAELSQLELVNPKMSLSWQPPEHVEIVGSYLLRTVVRPTLNVDVAVRIPQTCLLHKDYLDHRYVDKRMMYLTYLGAQLARSSSAESSEDEMRLSFVWLPHLQDRRWPVLQITLPGVAGGWAVRLIPSLAVGAMAPGKLLPHRANLRDRQVDSAGHGFDEDGTSGDAILGAVSPEYNNRLALESAYGPALRLLHAAYSADADGTLREATIMLKVWLRQRSIDQAGGLCGFQLSLLLVHLLAQRVLSYSMGAYHIFRVVLTHLSKASLESSVIVLPLPPESKEQGMGPVGIKSATSEQQAERTAAAAQRFGRYFVWVMTDSELSVNFGSGVTRGALRELRACALRSIVAIDSVVLDDAISFAELFTCPQHPSLRYDAIFSFEIPNADGVAAAHLAARAAHATKAAAAASRASSDNAVAAESGDASISPSSEDASEAPTSEGVVSSMTVAAEAVLGAGLARRARLVRCWHEALAEEPLRLIGSRSDGGARADLTSRIHVGVHFEPALISGLVDRGPVPGGAAATAWLELWGDKSETRRFRDGAVVHAVVWSADETSRHLVPAQVVRYLLTRHLLVERVVTSLAAVDEALLHHAGAGKNVLSGTWTSAAGRYIAAYEKLAFAIRKLEGLPLAISSIQPMGAVFAHCEEFPPTAAEAEAAVACATGVGGSTSDSAVARFVVQFESSGRWPDDLEAVAALKTAFYLKLADLLEAQAAPIRCEPRRGGLVVLVDGLPLLGTIMHRKEGKLLTESGDAAGAVALALATSAGVAHTAAMHVIASKNAAFGPTARLVKRWLHCQLCSGTFRPQLVELLVAYLFSPAAIRPPGSAFVGFLRFLALLSSHDFAQEPLIVQLAEELSPDVRATAQRVFSATREAHATASSAIWVATEKEPEGSVWCIAGPSVELVRRAQRLAASALSQLQQATSHATIASSRLVGSTSLGSNLATDEDISAKAMRVFMPPWQEFDALLHLDESQVPHGELRLATKDSRLPVATSRKYANLRPSPDAVTVLVRSLREAYEPLALFFYDVHGGDTIAVKWKPHAFLPRAFRPDTDVASIVVQRVMAKQQTPKSTSNRKGGFGEAGWLLPNVPEILEEMRELGAGIIIQLSLPSGGSQHIAHALK